MPFEHVPAPLGAVTAFAAAATAIAAAVRRVAIPMLKGLRALARSHQDIVEGAQLARRELQPNHGSSMKDRIDQTWERAEEARKQAVEVDERVQAVDERVQAIEERVDAAIKDAES